jgi:hypothetical protein
MSMCFKRVSNSTKHPKKIPDGLFRVGFLGEVKQDELRLAIAQYTQYGEQQCAADRHPVLTMRSLDHVPLDGTEARSD